MQNLVTLFDPKMGYVDLDSYVNVLAAFRDANYGICDMETLTWSESTGEVALLLGNGITMFSSFGRDVFYRVVVDDQEFEFCDYRSAVEFAQQTIWA